MAPKLELADTGAAVERLSRDPERFGVCGDTGRDFPCGRLDIISWARTGEESGA